jgi:hypothetical protein
MGLPSPDTLSLSQAVAFVVSRCDCTDSAAKDALRRAGREGRLESEGVLPLTALPRPRFPERYPPKCEDWGQQINWETSSVGRYSSVLITLRSIEAWLGPRQEAESSGAESAEKTADAAKLLTDTEPIKSQVAGTVESGAIDERSRKHAVRKLKNSDYRQRLSEFLRTNRKYPTAAEDQKWARDNDFHRDSLRACRKTCLPDTVTKGGPAKP